MAGLAEVGIVRAYFLPAFFAAQNAFNLADNLALAAGLIVFFLAVPARLTERPAALLPCSFAHLALWAAAIRFLAAALMVRLLVDDPPDLAGAPRIVPSSLLRSSICSLIAAARLSCLTVMSSKFIAVS